MDLNGYGIFIYKKELNFQCKLKLNYLIIKALIKYNNT